MESCKKSDFAPEWISRDLGITFQDIMTIIEDVDLTKTIIEVDETKCSESMELILAIE